MFFIFISVLPPVVQPNFNAVLHEILGYYYFTCVLNNLS
jgi:hypothetical protein